MAARGFSSLLLCGVGISFGDEGKGRLIPEVARDLAELQGRPEALGMVLKVNGGANSGHTVAGLKLNLLPAGVTLASGPLLGIGMGVVADPRKFHWELEYVRRRGFPEARAKLVIDERCMVSDLGHRLLDLAWERYRVEILGEEKRGSTGRGITPSYCDETGQWALHYADFLGPRARFAHAFRARLERAVATVRHVTRADEAAWHGFFENLTAAETRAHAEAIRAGAFPAVEFDFTRFRGREPFTLDLDLLEETYWQAGTALRDRVADVREVVRQCLAEGRAVIGEFGQSYWLDKRHGFAPNVTASHTFVAELFQTAGLPVQPVHAFGVCKAYDTKVGTHVFLTQFPAEHPLGRRLSTLEFGATTGRQRMVGWCDAVEKGDALRYGGFQEWMVNKLDALSSVEGDADELLICTAYASPDGRLLRGVPRDDHLRRACRAHYRVLPGWREDIAGVRRFADLPLNARRYVAAIIKAALAVAHRELLPAGWQDHHPLPALPGPPPGVRFIGVGPLPDQLIRDCPPTAELVALA